MPITQSNLEISEIGFDDSGDYECSASSGATTVTPINPTRIIVVPSVGKKVNYNASIILLILIACM